MKIAINGFGRIGRLVFKEMLKEPDLDVVAINDLAPTDNLAYLLKYDSTHGIFEKKIQAKEGELEVEGKAIKVFSERDPSKLPWKDLGVEIVIEATGLFTHEKDAQVHLHNGAKKVVLTAPGKGEIPTFVMGVNHEQYDPAKHSIISNASCTTNCLAPIVKVLLDHFGIAEGLMTTVHAVTATQPTVDGSSKKDFRGGRGAFQNIIPSSTGAAKAVCKCLPEVEGKLTGMAFRVPVANVSCVDLTVRLTQSTSYEAISQAMKQASEGPLNKILGYTEDPVVSSDFVGSTYSSIYDQGAGIGLNPHFYKLISWYDNEVGYSCRTVDIVRYMVSKER